MAIGKYNKQKTDTFMKVLRICSMYVMRKWKADSRKGTCII